MPYEKSPYVPALLILLFIKQKRKITYESSKYSKIRQSGKLEKVINNPRAVAARKPKSLEKGTSV